MAHFAELDNNNIVKQVIKIENEVMLDADGVEQESIGIEFCTGILGGKWVQTSYNGNFRNKYAGIGDIWNGTDFVSPVVKPDPAVITE